MDLAWLWPIRETMRKTARTFATVLANMELYDSYVFGASQPQQLLWMKEQHPELYEQIRESNCSCSYLLLSSCTLCLSFCACVMCVDLSLPYFILPTCCTSFLYKHRSSCRRGAVGVPRLNVGGA